MGPRGGDGYARSVAIGLSRGLSRGGRRVTGQHGGDPRAWRGIFAIPPTPFNEQGELDLAAMRRVIDFTVGCGAHGIVYPVMVSEFFVLAEAERAQLTPLVVRQAAGRCPVVIGVSATCTQAAVALARVAQ